MTDQATLTGSSHLLSEREQALFRRLAVFPGSFTLEAVEAICADESVTRDGVVDSLSRLVDLSLVVRHSGRRGARYSLHDPLRTVGSDQLRQSGEMRTLRDRHRAWFQDLPERDQEGNRSDWLDGLERELENFREAFAWSLEQHDLESAYRLVVALSPLWCARGHLTEGRDWLERLRGYADELPGEVKAEALLRLGVNAAKQEEHDLATAFLEQSLDLFSEQGNLSGVARAANALGVSALRRGNQSQARMHFEECLTVARQLGDDRRVASTLNNLGLVALKERDDDLADSLLAQALARARDQDNTTVMAAALANLGGVALRRGDRAGARAQLDASLGLYLNDGVRGGAAECLEGLAALAAAEGQEQRAARLMGSAESLRQAMGLSANPSDSAFSHLLDGLDGRLTESSLAAEYLAGRAMPLEETIAYALAQPLITAEPSLGAPEARGATALGGATAALTIRGLGPVQVQRDGQVLTRSDWTYSKARELLLFLLNHASRTKEQIGVALWPDISPTQLRGTFRTTMYHLRRTLGRRGWILYTGDGYALDRSLDYWYDVEAFEKAVARARDLKDGSPFDAIALLQGAIELYRGPFLEDLSDGQWYVLRREQLGIAFLDALLLLGQLAFAQRWYERAAEAYQRVIRLDGYLEVAHRQLMRCYQALGERAQALRHYDALVSRLRDDLGISPDDETAALAARLRVGKDRPLPV